MAVVGNFGKICEFSFLVNPTMHRFGFRHHRSSLPFAFNEINDIDDMITRRVSMRKMNSCRVFNKRPVSVFININVKLGNNFDNVARVVVNTGNDLGFSFFFFFYIDRNGVHVFPKKKTLVFFAPRICFREPNVLIFINISDNLAS